MNCPKCNGTGKVPLFTSMVPCECFEETITLYYPQSTILGFIIQEQTFTVIDAVPKGGWVWSRSEGFEHHFKLTNSHLIVRSNKSKEEILKVIRND